VAAAARPTLTSGRGTYGRSSPTKSSTRSRRDRTRYHPISALRPPRPAGPRPQNPEASRRPRIPKAKITGSTALPREVACKINHARGLPMRAGGLAAGAPNLVPGVLRRERSTPPWSTEVRAESLSSPPGTARCICRSTVSNSPKDARASLAVGDINEISITPTQQRRESPSRSARPTLPWRAAPSPQRFGRREPGQRVRLPDHKSHPGRHPGAAAKQPRCSRRRMPTLGSVVRLPISRGS
jgi:hypothetical protein